MKITVSSEMAMTTKPKTETYFVWREFRQVEGEDAPRLLIPWADPHEYEFSFDFLFETPAKARKAKASDDFGPSSEEDWVLCKLTVEPVE